MNKRCDDWMCVWTVVQAYLKLLQPMEDRKCFATGGRIAHRQPCRLPVLNIGPRDVKSYWVKRRGKICMNGDIGVVAVVVWMVRGMMISVTGGSD